MQGSGPCTFSSRRLSQAERNYDMGNRKLLAVVWALQEWRHWLEGNEVPFIIWTNHKNLAYLRSARRMNAQQARWALFLSQFNYSVSYCPGSKNTKLDALSRLYSPHSSLEEPGTVIPPHAFSQLPPGRSTGSSRILSKINLILGVDRPTVC